MGASQLWSETREIAAATLAPQLEAAPAPAAVDVI
jgi:hypothetical protein